MGELSNSGGNLETLVEDNLLALKANVFGPLDEAGKITSRLDVLAWGMLGHRRDSQVSYLPMPKFLGVASKRGFFLAFADLLAPKGAAAGFLPDLALGGWSLRRS